MAKPIMRAQLDNFFKTHGATKNLSAAGRASLINDLMDAPIKGNVAAASHGCPTVAALGGSRFSGSHGCPTVAALGGRVAGLKGKMVRRG